jgi:hypothetical protein
MWIRIKEFFRRPAVRVTSIAIVALVAVAIVALVTWIISLDREVAKRFAEKRFAPPIEFYSAPGKIAPGDRFPASELEQVFVRKAYTHRDVSQSMSPGDYSAWTGDECRSFLGIASAPPTDPALDQEL